MNTLKTKSGGSLKPVGSAPACPPDCGHTDQEHKAFDSGLRAGEQGQAAAPVPYRRMELVEAWLTGHSVGQLNRRAAEAQNHVCTFN
jgi:ribosome modulation factor